MTSASARPVIRLSGVVAVLAASLSFALALDAGTQAGTAAAAALTWSGVNEVQVTPPANAGSEPGAFFSWGACPTAGSCAGVGSYTDENGNKEALVATRANGSWGSASEVALPANARSTNQNARFELDEDTLACTAPGACVAVGLYLKEGGELEAMVTEETGGTWGQASEIAPPANAASNPEARFGTLVCPASGSCVAVGYYRDENGVARAMLAEETGGTWGQASEIAPPANAESDTETSIYSVACSAPGSCVAFGVYRDEVTQAREAMVLSETGGTWGASSQLALPANAGSKPRAELHSVACEASGQCAAVGTYEDSSENTQAMVVEATSGSWGQASEIALPANAASDPEVAFSTYFSYAGEIACSASGSCVIAGRYVNTAGEYEAMVAEGTGGSWGQASEIVLPANAATSNPLAPFLDALYTACPASGACVLIGSYKDENGAVQAMLAQQAGGSWGQASEIAAPANAKSNPQTLFGELQCPEAGMCLAFGEYTDSAGERQDMEVLGVGAPENTLAPVVSGTANVGQVLSCSQGTWTSSPTSYAYKWLRDGVAIGGAEAGTYTVAGADEGHSVACEVTASNSAGAKSQASANSVAVRDEAGERRDAEAAAARRLQEEEAAVAAKKKQAEEEAAAAAKKKRQEEEAAKAAVAGNVSLAGSTVGIQSGGKGSIKLLCTGTATCAGKLTLTVKIKARKGRKAKVQTIGTAAFSLPAGRTVTFTFTLTAAGRALLQAGHGQLSASLTILKSSPMPANTQHKQVHLVRKATKAKKPKH